MGRMALVTIPMFILWILKTTKGKFKRTVFHSTPLDDAVKQFGRIPHKLEATNPMVQGFNFIAMLLLITYNQQQLLSHLDRGYLGLM